MKFTIRMLSLAIAAAMCMVAAPAGATLLYSTDFNSPTYANGVLAGQDTWVVSSAAGTNDLSVSNAATNGIVSMTTSGNDDRRVFTAATSGSVYLAADINVTAAQTGDYFMSLGDGTATIFDSRIYIKSDGAGGFQMALLNNGSTAPTTYGASLVFGAHHIVAQYDFVAGASNDTGALFVDSPDPVFGSGSPYIVGVLGASDATSIAGVYLRQGGATSSATLAVDNIQVNAVAVPEPSTILLGAFGVVGLVGLARRRK